MRKITPELSPILVRHATVERAQLLKRWCKMLPVVPPGHEHLPSECGKQTLRVMQVGTHDIQSNMAIGCQIAPEAKLLATIPSRHFDGPWRFRRGGTLQIILDQEIAHKITRIGTEGTEVGNANEVKGTGDVQVVTGGYRLPFRQLKQRPQGIECGIVSLDLRGVIVGYAKSTESVINTDIHGLHSLRLALPFILLY